MGTHRLCTAVEPIRMTSLSECLARNVVAYRPVGAAIIYIFFAARNYMIRNLCTLPHSVRVHLENTLFLPHWQYCVIVNVLRVFGWPAHFAFRIQLECASECVILHRVISRFVPFPYSTFFGRPAEGVGRSASAFRAVAGC